MTEYRILSSDDVDRGWDEAGVVNATGPEQAIRKLIEQKKIEEPVPYWRAVPTRSWPDAPIQVEVEVETKVTFK